MTRPESEGPPRIPSVQELETSDTERPPPDPIDWPEPGPADEVRTNPHGADPIEDPEHLAIVAKLEKGFDLRWQAREDALVDRLSRVMADSQRPILDQLDELRGAVQMCHAAAERAANAGVDVVTLRDQIAVIATRCQRNHGPLASLPPGV
jgi:hypothetical protein